MEQNKRKNSVVEEAFILACEFLKDHPPDLNTVDDIEIIDCIYRDSPYSWGAYFVRKVLEEMKK